MCPNEKERYKLVVTKAGNNGVILVVLSKMRTYCLSKNKVANKVAITQMSSQYLPHRNMGWNI